MWSVAEHGVMGCVRHWSRGSGVRKVNQAQNVDQISPGDGSKTGEILRRKKLTHDVALDSEYILEHLLGSNN